MFNAVKRLERIAWKLVNIKNRNQIAALVVCCCLSFNEICWFSELLLSVESIQSNLLTIARIEHITYAVSK